MAEINRKRSRKAHRNDNDKVAGRALKMHDVRCDSLSYHFKVALDKFDFDALRTAIHVEKDTTRSFHAVNTRDSELSDYHAHFEWRVRTKEKEISLDITYVGTTVKSKPGEEEPFSDNLMKWVGQFFKHDDANARVHSDFNFEAKTATLSWFPLPLRTKIANFGGEAILDGIAVALPSKPDGVGRFCLSQIKDAVFVGIESERRIKFADFSLDKDLKVERALADKVIEAKP
jgi:hypothetical protein